MTEMVKEIKLNYFLIIFFSLFLSQTAYGALVTQTIEYKQADTTLEGYLAYDDSVSGKRPAVIVVHEWKGLDDYAKMRAVKLANLGYVAFAADIYGKGVRPKNHQEAGTISGAYKKDRNLMRERGKAAYDYLRNHELVDPARIAAIGYCFGGVAVLEMARAGFNLKGVATFHGFLDTPVPAKKGDIKSKILVFHGADDPFVPQKDVLEFQHEMTRAGVDWQLVIFGGAVHRFTVAEAGDDPSKGFAYNRTADERSWEMLESFLSEIFLSEPIPS